MKEQTKKSWHKTGQGLFILGIAASIVYIPIPEAILVGIKWCLIISCIGYWVRNIVDFMTTDIKDKRA